MGRSADTKGIQLDGLTWTKPGAPVVGPFDLSLTEQRIGVVGRNGSGKSTFARLITGLIEATEGSATIWGTDMWSDRKGAIRAAGILFQNPDHQIIFPTVEEEIAFGLTQLGYSKTEARDGAHRVLKQFNKDHWAEKSIHTMSGGQRHLVCLMSVLAMAPKLIVLDEPYAGLDIPTRRAMAAYLQGLDQQILHITHEPDVLRGYDRILWIEGGQVCLDGAPDMVLPAYLNAMEAADAGSDLTD